MGEAAPNCSLPASHMEVSGVINVTPLPPLGSQRSCKEQHNPLLTSQTRALSVRNRQGLCLSGFPLPPCQPASQLCMGGAKVRPAGNWVKKGWSWGSRAKPPLAPHTSVLGTRGGPGFIPRLPPLHCLRPGQSRGAAVPCGGQAMGTGGGLICCLSPLLSESGGEREGMGATKQSPSFFPTQDCLGQEPEPLNSPILQAEA